MSRYGRRTGRGEPALVLGQVELAVGLELLGADQVLDRLGPHGVDDLVLIDRDAVLLVLRLHDRAVDELVPDLVPDLLGLLQAQAARGLPLLVVDGLLHRGLIGAGIDRPGR